MTWIMLMIVWTGVGGVTVFQPRETFSSQAACNEAARELKAKFENRTSLHLEIECAAVSKK